MWENEDEETLPWVPPATPGLAEFEEQLVEIQKTRPTANSSLSNVCLAALVADRIATSSADATPWELCQEWKNVLPADWLTRAATAFAVRRMQTELDSRGASFEIFCDFLRETGGVSFGSFPLACLLGKSWWDDVDVLTPIADNTANRCIRLWVSKLVRGVPSTELYEPRDVCSVAAQVNCDPQLFDYLCTHETESGFRVDVMRSKDVRGLLAARSLDVDRIVFDGVRFLGFEGDADLHDFLERPRCRVEAPANGFAFEKIYDPWCIHCQRQADGGVRTHVGTDYQEVCDSTEEARRILRRGSEAARGVPKLLKFEREAFARFGPCIDESADWLSNEDFVDLKTLAGKVVPRFVHRDADSVLMSEYRILKLFLRLSKLARRGVPCDNFDDVFAPNVVAQVERSPIKFDEHVRSLVVSAEPEDRSPRWGESSPTEDRWSTVLERLKTKFDLDEEWEANDSQTLYVIK